MTLTTKITDSSNIQVSYSLKATRIENSNRISVTLRINDKIAGSMEISPTPYSVYIHRINNYSSDWENPLKHVGTLLFEYAFKTSLKWERQGRVELQSVGNSAAAFVLMGFKTRTLEANYLRDKIYIYYNDPTPENKNAIIDHPSYNGLLKEAASTLKKSSRNVTFDQAISDGLYPHDAHLEFEKKINDFKKRNKKINNADLAGSGMGGMMFLPEETITALKQKFRVEPFSPIAFSSATPR